MRKSWDFWVCKFEWIYKFNLVQKCSIMRHCGPQLLCCCCAVVATSQLQQTFMKKVFATSASWETLCVEYCLVYVSACCVDICVDTACLAAVLITRYYLVWKVEWEWMECNDVISTTAIALVTRARNEPSRSFHSHGGAEPMLRTVCRCLVLIVS